MTVRELIVQWGFKVDDRRLRALDSTINATRTAILAVGAAGVAAAGAIFGLARSVGQAADAAGEAAQRVGISAKNLQEFQYAAKLGGLEAEGAETAIGFLSRSMVEAAKGGKESAASFRALGVRVRGAKGELRPTYDVMLDVADAFAKMPDGAEKTALAMRVFGRSGRAMIPTLNLGRVGISKLADEANRLGVVLSGETIAAADEWERKTVAAEAAIVGIKNTIGSALLPVVGDIADKIRKWAGENRELIAQKVTEWLQRAVEWGAKAWTWFDRMATRVGDLVAAVGGLDGAIRLLATGWAAFKAAEIAVGVWRLFFATSALAGLAGPIGLLAAGLVAVALNWDTVSRHYLMFLDEMAHGIDDFLNLPVIKQLMWLLDNLFGLTKIAGFVGGVEKTRFASPEEVSRVAREADAANLQSWLNDRVTAPVVSQLPSRLAPPVGRGAVGRTEIVIHQNLPPGTPEATRRAAAEGGRMAADSVSAAVARAAAQAG